MGLAGTALEEMAGQFMIRGDLVSVLPFEMGHIHDSFVSTWENGSRRSRYLHQRINQTVFRDVEGLMSNIVRVTEHLAGNCPKGETSLTLVDSRCGRNIWIDDDRAAWRTFCFIEQTDVFDLCPDSDHAFEAGRIFASLILRLSDFPGDSLSVTIPHFFHTPTRLSQLKEAARMDRAGRLEEIGEEIDFVMERDSFCSVVTDPLERGLLPSRVIHYDPKLNNVLFNRHSGRAACVVDLDTCMPGSPLYDFGDLVRTCSVVSPEDEPDTSRVAIDLHFFSEILRGYCFSLEGLLSEAEMALMARAPRLAALTIGMRFLSDYLDGDIYFKIEHRNHNLQRARAQFALVRHMEKLAAEMEDIVVQVTQQRNRS